MAHTAPSHISSSFDHGPDTWSQSNHLVTLKERPREQQKGAMMSVSCPTPGAAVCFQASC